METLISTKTQSWLSWFIRGLVILGFLILFARLIDLQVIRGAYFRSLAEENRIRRVLIVAPRGKIMARGGEVLVGNRQIEKRIIFKKGEGYEKSQDTKEAEDDEIITEWERLYYLGDAFGHVSGYLGEVDKDEVGKVDPLCFEKGAFGLGSLVGRSGLEEEYNCALSGINGEELVEVDSFGNRIRTLGTRQAVAGQDIKTNIDFHLQEMTAELMKDKAGAVVVTDAEGEVLALYSSPSYDPNIFVGKDGEKIESVLNNPELPLFNRVIGGKYPPGSIYKPIVAISALQEEKIDEDYVYEDTGSISVDTAYGKFTYNNWYFSQYGRVEGELTLPRAIARSTDTFFYKVGELVGIDKLVEWSEKLGLDERSRIDLPGEIKGLVPSPQWKEEIKGERWFLGNTYHMAIGQGDLAVTPIGINRAISTIATGGTLCDASVVKEVSCRQIKLDEEGVWLVKEGMRQACKSGGTAFPFFDFDEDVACKTGTAEIGGSDKTHAWFTAFSPVDKPEIFVTVLVEEGGEGSYVAAPIARRIMDYWYKKPISTPTPILTND